MKKHGFTLIELIVVIAIIGVLAAILVPALLGYVARSKITTANTSAKSLADAVNTSMIELSAYDVPPKQLVGCFEQTGQEIYAAKDLSAGEEIRLAGTDSGNRKQHLTNALYSRIVSYFSDVNKIGNICFQLSEEGQCKAVGVMKGSYPGTYPISIDTDAYHAHSDAHLTWDSEYAMLYALYGPEQYRDKNLLNNPSET